MPIAPPLCPPVTELLPLEPVLLMGAGPTPISDTVSRANGIVISHLGEPMNTVLGAVRALGAYAFQTASPWVLGVNGPASACNEMAIANLLWPGRKALCLCMGTFSDRLADMARGVGAEVVELRGEERQPISVEAVAQALAKESFDLVTVVQGETSCGVRQDHIQEISALAHAHGAMMLVDAVCTLTTTPLPMDEWGLDVVITGGQKGLASIPGVSLIAFSDRAWAVTGERPRPMPHWCYDARRAWKFWGEHQYHYTAPVPGILALHEALRLIAEEGLEARFARHARCSAALQAGLAAMGLRFLVPPEIRLPSVLAVENPLGEDSKPLRAHMMGAHGVEVAGAFGLKIVRIGQMGEQCRPANLYRVLHALGASLGHLGHPMDIAAGMAALGSALGE